MNSRLAGMLFIVWISVTTSLFLLTNEFPSERTYHNEFTVNYFQYQNTVPWSYTLRDTVWGGTVMRVNIMFNGSILMKLCSGNDPGNLNQILYQFNNSGYGTRNMNYRHTFEFIEPRVIQLRFTYIPIQINESDPLSELALMKKAVIMYKLKFIENPIPQQWLSLVSSALGFLLFLGFTGIEVIRRIIEHKTTKELKREKESNKSENDERIIVFVKGLEQARPKRTRVLWKENIWGMIPDFWFLMTWVLGFVYLRFMFIRLPAQAPINKNSFLIALFPVFDGIINELKLEFPFFAVILGLTFFVHQYLSEDYDHQWSYPNIKKVLFFQVNVVNQVLVWLVYGVFMISAMITFVLLYHGDMTRIGQGLLYLGLGTVMIYGVTMIFVNLFLAVNNFTRNAGLTSVVSVGMLLFVEQVRISGLSFSRYFHEWERNEFLVGSMLTTVTMFLVSYIVLYISFLYVGGLDYE